MAEGKVDILSETPFFVFVDKAAVRGAHMSFQTSCIGIKWPKERNAIE